MGNTTGTKRKKPKKTEGKTKGWGSRLSTHNLHKEFGKRAVVRDVSVELRQGEVVGLLGPNGAGKTTTFSMIIGFLQPTKGSISIDGKIINELPIFRRARMGIGYLSQEPSVFRKLRVEDNISSILELRGFDRDEIKIRTEELLKKFEITGLRKAKGGTLSGGERRRVEIARALATQPKFLLLDEPFTGIDPIVRGEIQKIIRLLKEDGIGILVTDHNVRETLEITDRAYLMYDSRIMIQGTPEELVSNDRVREVYLGKEFKI